MSARGRSSPPPRAAALPVAADPPPAFVNCGGCAFWHRLYEKPAGTAFGECRGVPPQFPLEAGYGGPVVSYGQTRASHPRCRIGEPRA